jgi:hypothetical protein
MTSASAPRRASTKKAPKKVPVRRTTADDTMNARVIELRSHPRSFAYIANELELGHARNAFDVFLTALQSRSVMEQQSLRAEESGRLDDLEKRTRKRSAPAELDRKLAAIALLRERLMAASSK